MAQFYKVVKAFKATDKETGETVVDSYGNVKFMFQVEGQGPEGWMSLQKKEGSELSVGDYVYGIVDTWPEGKAKFVKQQVPEGTAYPDSGNRGGTATEAAAKQGAAPQQSSTGVEAKLDYIISLLENNAQFQGAGSERAVNDTVPTDIDDGPVDLSQLEY